MSSTPVSLTHAIVLFNQQAFFECHEVLEDLWRPLPPGAQKQFLQGLIQVAVGFHHLRHHNYIGAKNLLQAGIEKLDVTVQRREYQSPLLLPSFLQACQEALQTVLRLGPNRIAEFPDTLIPRIAPQPNI